MNVPISMLRDGDWFRLTWAGNRRDPRPQEMAVGRVVSGNACSVKVRYTRRWGQAVKEMGDVSPETMVARIAEPVADVPPDAARTRGLGEAFDVFDEVI